MKFRERRQLQNETDVSLRVPPQMLAGDGPREFEAERLKPGREPNVESDVLTPVLTTLFVAVGSALLGWYFAWFFRWPYHTIIPVTLITAGVYFVSYTRLTLKTLWITERVFHTDLDGDGVIGEPPAGPQVTELSARIERDDGTAEYKIGTLNIPEHKVRQWAREVTQGKSLAIGHWVGQHNIFSRSEYQTFLATLGEMGLAEDKKGNVGWSLTPTGQSYFRDILAQ